MEPRRAAIIAHRSAAAALLVLLAAAARAGRVPAYLPAPPRQVRRGLNPAPGGLAPDRAPIWHHERRADPHQRAWPGMPRRQLGERLAGNGGVLLTIVAGQRAGRRPTQNQLERPAGLRQVAVVAR